MGTFGGGRFLLNPNRHAGAPMAPPDLAILRWSTRQFAAFSRHQAHDAGFSNRQIRQRVGSGRWTEPHRDSFRLAGIPETPQAAIMSAVLALPRASAGFDSAAFLWTMTPRHQLPHLIREHGYSHPLPGIRLHQTRWLPGHHLTRIGPIPVTTRSRTICDLASTWSDEAIGDIVDRQIQLAVLRLSQLATTHAELTRPGRPGVRRMARVLDERAGLTDCSALHRRFCSLAEANGVPPGRSEARAPWLAEVDRCVERVDVAFDEQQVLVELDGRSFHARLADFDNDRRRDHLAILAGWTPLRFTWLQVTQEPEHVLTVLRHALGLTLE